MQLGWLPVIVILFWAVYVDAVAVAVALKFMRRCKIMLY